MAIWTLDTDSDFTQFYFPIKEDKTLFHDLVKNYFEECKAVSEKWKQLLMMRGEPMKHPDFFSIDETDVIAISQNAVESLKEFLGYKIELLPIKTDSGMYYALNVLNFVDCLNNSESEFQSTKGGVIVSYSLLEFDEEKLGKNKIFKIPEIPYQIFITHSIQEQYDREDFRGLMFDKNSNLIWYPE